MHIRCWQCSEELDTISIEKAIYQELIEDFRSRLCEDSVNDFCSLWWRHEDCLAIGNIIESLKERI